jgi:hypothetical protein
MAFHGLRADAERGSKKRAHAVRHSDIAGLLNQVNGDRQRQYVQMLAKAIINPYIRNANPRDDPFPRASTVRVKRREYIPLTIDERGRLLREIKDHPFGAFYMLAMATGEV